MGTAPSSHSSSWSVCERAEKFHSVPHALDTIVSEGERSCDSSRDRQFSSRRILLEIKMSNTETEKSNIKFSISAEEAAALQL